MKKKDDLDRTFTDNFSQEQLHSVLDNSETFQFNNAQLQNSVVPSESRLDHMYRIYL